MQKFGVFEKQARLAQRVIRGQAQRPEMRATQGNRWSLNRIHNQGKIRLSGRFRKRIAALRIFKVAAKGKSDFARRPRRFTQK